MWRHVAGHRYCRSQRPGMIEISTSCGVNLSPGTSKIKCHQINYMINWVASGLTGLNPWTGISSLNRYSTTANSYNGNGSLRFHLAHGNSPVPTIGTSVERHGTTNCGCSSISHMISHDWGREFPMISHDFPEESEGFSELGAAAGLPRGCRTTGHGQRLAGVLVTDRAQKKPEDLGSLLGPVNWIDTPRILLWYHLYRLSIR